MSPGKAAGAEGSVSKGRKRVKKFLTIEYN